MKKLFLMVAISLLGYILQAQVGINNTDPKASLDISASNVTNPSNTDGILIPRIDEFPSANPGAAQEGMMVFVTGNGTPTKGFYYWDNGTTSWVTVNNVADADWYQENTTSPPTLSTDDIFTDGNVGIGVNNVQFPLQIETPSSTRTINLLNENTGSSVTGLHNTINESATSSNGSATGINNIITRTNQSSISGVANSFSNSVSTNSFGYLYGYQNSFGTSTSTTSYGLLNRFQGVSTTASGMTNLIGNTITNFYGVDNHDIPGSAMSGNFYGLYNNLTNSGNGTRYGVYTDFSETGSGNKYGEFITIATAAGGTHYGIYADVQNSSGYAGYFLGRTSLGTATTNRYLMPAADGTAGQVMTTDGAGNVSFTTVSSTDDQTIDTFDFNSGTNLLSLEIEDDGVAVQTVDLSSLDDEDADWLTTVGSNVPTSNNDDIYTLGNVSVGSSINIANFNINHNEASDGTIDYLQYNTVSNSGNDDKTIIYNSFGSAQAGNNTAMYNLMIGNGSGTYRGVHNYSYASVTGDIFGVYNVFSANGNGAHYGSRTSLSGIGSGLKYGTYNYISPTAGGTHYGIYADVQNAGGYAGYFIGRTSLGNGTTNRYLMPAADGTAGQVMTTNGAGNVSWANASDTDWVDSGVDIERQSGDVYIGNTSSTNNDLYISDRLIDWDNTTYYINPDDISNVDEIQYDNGSVADPSIRFSDTNTGFFSPSTATTAYSANGVEAFRIQSDGKISMGLTALTNYKLAINSLSNTNQIRIGNDLFSDNVVDITHGGQQGNSLDISVNSIYTLASRSGISVFNDAGDTQVDIGKYESGTNNYYGLEVNIPVNGGGVEYGIYSDVQTSNGYAGFFLGRTSLGTATTNRYIMPGADGANGQVMTTDGAGNVSWATPSATTASNGLTETGNDVQLGGALTANTTISQGLFDINFSLNSTAGVFSVDTNALVVENTGDVGFGTAAPAYDVDVSGNEISSYIVNMLNSSTGAQADGIAIRLGLGTISTNRFIDFYRSGGTVNSGSVQGNGAGINYATTSDRRLKMNIYDISNALERIDNFQPRIYEYKEFPGKKEMGFIAQELQKVYPQAVSGDESGDPKTNPMMVDYSRLTPILTAGIKELYERVKKLEEENAMLKEENKKYKALEARIRALENK